VQRRYFPLHKRALPDTIAHHFIRANDRATMLNLMIGLNGFTLCSGILCEELNGADYCAVKLHSEEKMTIGYLTRKDAILSPIAEKYLEEISKYKNQALQ